MRVKSNSELPNGTVCGDPSAINRVRVSAANMPDTYDASSFCVTKPVLGVTSQPETGAELLYIAAGFIALIGIGLVGKRFVGSN